MDTRHTPLVSRSVLWPFILLTTLFAWWGLANNMAALNLEEIAKNTPEMLRNIEPVSRVFYDFCEMTGLTGFIPKTAEQCGATFYIFSQILFIGGRFSCTGLMSRVRPSTLLMFFALGALTCCSIVTASPNLLGVYALVCASGFMSLMFPTIFSYGTRGLGDDTKMAGAGMVTMLCGGAILTQIQGTISDASGSIALAYAVPTFAFFMILCYAVFVCRKLDAHQAE